jgi:hypothetical protein
LPIFFNLARHGNGGGEMNDDIPALLFALSSCSIEGSELAIELLELKDKDPDLFLQKCKEAGFLKELQ